MLIDELEKRLDSFDASERRKALTALREMVETGVTPLPKAGTDVNLHAHTFFSFNSYGYSPSKLAWLFRKEGLAAGEHRVEATRDGEPILEELVTITRICEDMIKRKIGKMVEERIKAHLGTID